MTGTEMAVDLDEALAFAGETATAAAALARRMVAGDLEADLKADGTLVTNVDTAVERFLRDAIQTRYPAHAILGEEYGWDGKADVPLWALDPIDGTTNLAYGIPVWCVSVALVMGDTPVVGVVSAPLLGQTFAAARGLGATANGVPLPPLPPGGVLRWEDPYAVCSNSVRDLDFGQTRMRLRIPGSAALDLCWTAAGHLRGCQSIGTKLYDVAAGVCLAREVGAVTEWLSGKPWLAAEMAREGPRNEALLTAPPATVAFLRENIRRR